MIQDSGAM